MLDDKTHDINASDWRQLQCHIDRKLLSPIYMCMWPRLLLPKQLIEVSRHVAAMSNLGSFVPRACLGLKLVNDRFPNFVPSFGPGKRISLNHMICPADPPWNASHLVMTRLSGAGTEVRCWWRGSWRIYVDRDVEDDEQPFDEAPHSVLVCLPTAYTVLCERVAYGRIGKGSVEQVLCDLAVRQQRVFFDVVT